MFFFLWGAVAGEMLMIAGPLGPARECGTTKVNEEFLSSLKERGFCDDLGEKSQRLQRKLRL